MPGSGSSRTAEVSWLVVTRYASVDVSTCFNICILLVILLVIPLGRWALFILLVLVSHPTGCVWKCCVPHCTQWFCWSLSLYIPIKWLFHWEYTQHFQTNPTGVDRTWTPSAARSPRIAASSTAVRCGSAVRRCGSTGAVHGRCSTAVSWSYTWKLGKRSVVDWSILAIFLNLRQTMVEHGRTCFKAVSWTFSRCPVLWTVTHDRILFGRSTCDFFVATSGDTRGPHYFSSTVGGLQSHQWAEETFSEFLEGSSHLPFSGTN